MGLFDFTKKWKGLSVNEVFHPFRYVYKSPGEFTFPETDESGHEALPVCDINIVGVLHSKDGVNPQEIIPQMFEGDRVLLEADPRNAYDKNAVMVKTHDGVQIGWLPKKTSLQIDIFDRLMKGQAVYAKIKEGYELSTNPGNIGLCIEVARYASR